MCTCTCTCEVCVFESVRSPAYTGYRVLSERRGDALHGRGYRVEATEWSTECGVSVSVQSGRRVHGNRHPMAMRVWLCVVCIVYRMFVSDVHGRDRVARVKRQACRFSSE